MHIFYDQMILDIQNAANYKLAAASNPMGGSAKNTGAPKVKSTKSVSDTRGKVTMARPMNTVIPEQSLGRAVSQVITPGDALSGTGSVQAPQLGALSANNGLFLPSV